jgi:hypothetical protein
MRISKAGSLADRKADLLNNLRSVQSLDKEQLWSHYCNSRFFSDVFRGLMQLWTIGYVHTELAGFSHVAGNRHTIVWCPDFDKGIQHYDMYIRQFSKGINDSNISVGFRDGEPWAKLEDLEHCERVNVDSRGFGLLANSIMQSFIISVHAVITFTRMSNELGHAFSLAMLNTCLDFVYPPVQQEHFLARLEGFSLDDLFTEMKHAIVSDRLKVVPFVSLAEKFILECKLLHDRDALMKYLKERHGK